MAIVRQDTFVRANTGGSSSAATGWGTASDGNGWAQLSGVTNAGTFSILSNQGKYLGTSTASQWVGLGAAIVPVDVDVVARVQCSFGNTGDAFGLVCRASSATTYMIGRILNASGWNVNLLSKVAGTTKTNSSAAITTPTANSVHWLRLRFSGSSVFLRHWIDGNAEPSTWDLGPITDTNFSSAGQVGIYGFMNGPSESMIWDNFAADDMAPLPHPTIVNQAVQRAATR